MHEMEDTIKLKHSTFVSQPVNAVSFQTTVTYEHGNFWLSQIGLQGIVFKVRAARDAHIGLGAILGNTNVRMYKVKFGNYDNTKCTILTTPYGLEVAKTDCVDIMSATEMRAFWISWFNDTVKMGEGDRIDERTILSWDATDPHPVVALSFSTGWGADGDWHFTYLEGRAEADIHAEDETVCSISIKLKS